MEEGKLIIINPIAEDVRAVSKSLAEMMQLVLDTVKETKNDTLVMEKAVKISESITNQLCALHDLLSSGPMELKE